MERRNIEKDERRLDRLEGRLQLLEILFQLFVMQGGGSGMKIFLENMKHVEIRDADEDNPSSQTEFAKEMLAQVRNEMNEALKAWEERGAKVHG